MDFRMPGVLVLMAAGWGACHATPFVQPPAIAEVVPLFGPVVSAEVIKGREYAEGAVLLLVESSIVRVDLGERQATRTPIQLEPGEACWGLARLADGSLWSLKGRSAVIEITPDGRVLRSLPLMEPHAGLFAAGDRLVVQKAVSTAAEPLLRAGAPGSDAMQTWSELKGRPFPGIARAQASALSLVACGVGERAERPCWFPDEPALSLIARDGTTRRIALPGLTAISPETLLTAENPRRPVRDAYIDGQGRVWVLSTGDAPAGAVDRPGGWLLVRYSADGAPQGQVRLSEAARLILRVERNRVIVLASSGHVGEVASW